MIVDIRQVNKDYEQGKMSVKILKNIDLSVEKGEYIAIMGPSGSGKTSQQSKGTLRKRSGSIIRYTEKSRERIGKRHHPRSTRAEAAERGV